MLVSSSGPQLIFASSGTGEIIEENMQVASDAKLKYYNLLEGNYNNIYMKVRYIMLIFDLLLMTPYK